MSQNLDTLFPKARLDAMIAAARDARRNWDDPSYTSGQAPELLRHFDSGEFHRDAAESWYVARQLEHIRPGVDEAEFPELMISRLVPFDTNIDPGAESYTAQYETQVGRARLSRDMKGIVPRVDMSTGEDTYPFFSLMLAYGYSLQDVRAAMKAGKPLAARKALLCREQLERDHDEIGFLGSASLAAKGSTLKGLLTQSGTSTYTTPTGSTGFKSWLEKSPKEILADLNAIPSQVVTDTLRIERPDTLVLPNTRFEHIANLMVGDGTNDMVLTHYRRNQQHIKNIESSHWGEAANATAGGWTGCRAVAYEKNPSKIVMPVPVAFEQLMPDVTSTETVVSCHIRTGGVILFRKKAMIYADEV